jgi:hypothetical protein
MEATPFCNCPQGAGRRGSKAVMGFLLQALLVLPTPNISCVEFWGIKTKRRQVSSALEINLC